MPGRSVPWSQVCDHLVTSRWLGSLRQRRIPATGRGPLRCLRLGVLAAGWMRSSSANSANSISTSYSPIDSGSARAAVASTLLTSSMPLTFTNSISAAGRTGRPAGPFGAYTDYVSPRYFLCSLLAALEHRRRTGQGQYIDFSQSEGSIHNLSPLLLDFAVNGRITERTGNDA